MNLSAKTNDGRTALFLAAEKNNFEIVELLLKAGDWESLLVVDDKDRSSLWIAASNGHCETLKLILKYSKIHKIFDRVVNMRGGEENVTPIYRAMQRRRFKCVRMLKFAGADLNADAKNIISLARVSNFVTIKCLNA